MDFSLLISLVSEMDIHRKYWNIYEEHGSERWSQLEEMYYNHHVDCSGDSQGAYISQTIMGMFEQEGYCNLTEWTLALAVDVSKAEVYCYSRFLYSDHPHCLRLPNFYEKEAASLAELPAILREASDALMNNLLTMRREKRCRSSWEEAQAAAYARLKEHEISMESQSKNPFPS